MEFWHMTIDGQKHQIPWHTFKSAESDSYIWDGGVLVYLHPTHNAWMHVGSKHATYPEHEAAASKFFIREGKVFDVAGKRLSGIRK